MKDQNEVGGCNAHSHLSTVDNIIEIPQKILEFHHKAGLTDFVLQKIASDKCFSFNRAAYLVDNPDFNFLKGICGFCKNSNPDNFSTITDQLLQQISKADYNNKVKTFQKTSLKANNIDLKSSQTLSELSYALEIPNPQVYSWDLKNNNFGILIFKSEIDHCCDWKKNLLEKVTAFLGMCGFERT